MNLALSGKEGARARGAGAHRLLQLRGLRLGGQRRDPEAGQCFVLVLACGARTGPGLGIVCGGEGLGCRTHEGTCGTPPPTSGSSLSLTWAAPCRGDLGREGVEGPAHNSRLFLQEAPHVVLRRGPLQRLLLLSPGAPLLLVGLQAARNQ